MQVSIIDDKHLLQFVQDIFDDKMLHLEERQPESRYETGF